MPKGGLPGGQIKNDGGGKVVICLSRKIGDGKGFPESLEKAII